MFVYLNGKMLDGKDAKISVFDHGYLYGDGIFETMRAYRGKIFLEKEHLSRMEKSALALGIKISQREIQSAMRKLLLKNNLADAYVRVSISRGVGETGLNSKCGKPTVLVIAKHISIDKKIYEKGISCSTFVQDYSNPLNSKSLSFLNYVLARRSSKADEAIILNSKGEVKEGSISNVFIVKDNTAITPPVDNIVDGITRKVVMRLCRENHIPLEEKKIMREDLLSADECFITNSIKGIVPVVRAHGRRIGVGGIGEITKLLMEAYQKRTVSLT